MGPKAVRGLDKVSGFGLKRAVRKILTKKQAALVQQGLESARAEISNRLERGWEQVQRLEKRIEAAASMGLHPSISSGCGLHVLQLFYRIETTGARHRPTMGLTAGQGS